MMRSLNRTQSGMSCECSVSRDIHRATAMRQHPRSSIISNISGWRQLTWVSISSRNVMLECHWDEILHETSTQLTPSKHPLSVACARSCILCTCHQNSEVGHTLLQHITVQVTQQSHHIQYTQCIPAVGSQIIRMKEERIDLLTAHQWQSPSGTGGDTCMVRQSICHGGTSACDTGRLTARWHTKLASHTCYSSNGRSM